MLKKLFVTLALTVSISAFAESSKISVSQLQAAPALTPGIYTVSGMAMNVTDKVVKSAFIKFNLYDQQGNLVGNTMTMATGLEPHGTWKFKADTPTQFATFKISEISTFDN